MHYTVYSVLVILNDAFNADVINENEREGRLEEIQKALWMIWLIITDRNDADKGKPRVHGNLSFHSRLARAQRTLHQDTHELRLFQCAN
jgi:hypothetical protein